MSDVVQCPLCYKYVDATFTLNKCPKCNQPLEGFDLSATQPPTDTDSFEDISTVPSYIIGSVISLLFCGIFGIVATIYSVQTLRAKNNIDYKKAVYYSESAKKWMTVAYVLGCVSLFLEFCGRR